MKLNISYCLYVERRRQDSDICPCPYVARLQLHVTRTREECSKTVMRFLPLLKNRIFLLVDVDKPVKELKALKKGDERDAHLRLWEKIKIMSNTSFVLYGCCAFNILYL